MSHTGNYGNNENYGSDGNNGSNENNGEILNFRVFVVYFSANIHFCSIFYFWGG